MHDPANRTYDSACELLDAARRLAADLRRPEAAAVIAPTIACVEEALAALAAGVRAAAPPPGRAATLQRCAARLDDAGAACGQVREAAALSG